MLRLTFTRKAVLSQYLFATVSRWAAVFGVVNAAAIFISLGYVFFVLPQKASNEAQIFLRKDLADQTATLRATIDELNKSSGRATERMEMTNRVADDLTKAQASVDNTLKDLRRRVDVLDAQLGSVEKSDSTAIARFLADFNKNPDAKELITRVSALEREQQPILFGTGADGYVISAPVNTTTDDWDVMLTAPRIGYKENPYTPHDDAFLYHYMSVEAHTEKKGWTVHVDTITRSGNLGSDDLSNYLYRKESAPVTYLLVHHARH